MANESRLKLLDALRAVAVLLVIGRHLPVDVPNWGGSASSYVLAGWASTSSSC